MSVVGKDVNVNWEADGAEVAAGTVTAPFEDPAARLVTPRSEASAEIELETNLRPTTLADYQGQARVKENRTGGCSHIARRHGCQRRPDRQTKNHRDNRAGPRPVRTNRDDSAE